MMSTPPSANIADEVLYAEENNKFSRPQNTDIITSSPYLNNLLSTEISSIVTSSHQSQTFKHFLAQKYAAESTSDNDSESHSNTVNLPHSSQATFQHQISNCYPFSPLVSSSSHFDTRNILGDGVLESSVDSLQVESSTNEQSGHQTENHAIFSESGIGSIDTFVKQEDGLEIGGNSGLSTATATNVSSSSNQIEMVPSSLFETVNSDVIVDSTTAAANISTSATTLPSFTFNNFQSTTLSQPMAAGVVTYGLPSNFSASTILHLDNTQHLLPSTIQFDQYFNQPPNPLDKRDEHVILDQHQLLPPSTIQSFPSDNQCLLTDANLSDNFLADMQTTYNDETEIINAQENVISDLPVLTRARASLPIEYLFLSETDSGLGVFARKPISVRSQFGPIEGVITSFSDNQLSPSNLAYNSKNSLIIFISETVILSQTDENSSNWTRFVRPAHTAAEQNIELVTREFTNDFKFYFYATRNIMPNEELRVWYSKSYAAKFNIRIFDHPEEINLIGESEFDGSSKIILSNSSLQNLPTGGHKLRNKIAKSQLTQLQTNPECIKDQQQPPNGLQTEMNGMHELFHPSINVVTNEPIIVVNKIIDSNKNVLIIGDENSPASNIENLKPEAKNGMKKAEKYQCDKCQRVFPRHYSLRRHQVMHSGEKRYKCPICGMAFNHVYNRNRHIKMHKTSSDEPSKSQTLKNGTEAAATSSEVLMHDSDSGNPMSSNEVSTFGDDPNGSQHSSDDNSKSDSPSGSPNVTSSGIDNKGKSFNRIEKSFRCSQCYKRFSSEERLTKHAFIHDESAKKLSCDICKRKFLTNSALSCHIKYHKFSSEPRKFDCSLCDQVFDSIPARREHVSVHINPETGCFHCPKCSKTFETFALIRKHLKSYHSEEIFTCPQCEKVFPRQDKLRLHMLCHSDRWEFKCDICDKQFKRKDKLKEHTNRMHSPNRDIRMAAKIAARMQRLKVQRSKRVASKPTQPNYQDFVYKCHLCLFGFKRRGMLVNHLAKRHPDIPYNSVPELNMPIVKTSKDYYCQYCDKVYKSSSKRKAHIIKNHPGKSLPPSNRNKSVTPDVNQTFSATVGSITINPHFCDWCHKQYASKAKLMQHQRKKHPEKVPNTSMSKSKSSNNSTSCSSSPNMYRINTIITGDKATCTTVPIDSRSITLIKSEIDEQAVQLDSIDSYKNNDNFLSSGSPISQTFIDNFGIANDFSKANDTYLNGSSLDPHSTQAQYTIDSNDASFDDLLNMNLPEQHQNMDLINNPTTSTTSFSNNIITILVPTTCTTFSNDMNEFPGGISDIITQITSDFSNGKQLIDSNGLNSGDVGSDLMISDQIEDNNWNQVCEEMAIV